MQKLDEMYGVPIEGQQYPLIIIDGQVYQMINPLVYSGFLQLDKIMNELKHQVSRPTYGAMDLIGINLN